MIPLLKYLITTPSSGAVAAISDTSSGTALDLTCTNVTGTSITAGVGASFSGTGSGAVSAALNGTKVETALAGITTMTIEFVADTTADSGFMELAGLYDAAGTNDIMSVLTGSAGIGQVGVAGAGGTAAWFDVTPGRHHFFAVQNTNQASNTNRLLLWIDGVAASVNSSPFAPTYPTLGAAIDVGFTNYANNRICLGCLAAAGVQSFNGPQFAALFYASAGTSTDAAAHSTALLANNDTDPNGAVASFVPYRRRQLAPAEDPYFVYMGMRSATIQNGTQTPDNPPLGWPRRLAALTQWQPDEYPPTPRRRVQPPPVAPDNPPLGWPRRHLAQSIWLLDDSPAPPPRRFVTQSGVTPPAPPTPAAVNPFDWNADDAAIIGQMFRGGGFPFQV